MPIEIQAPDPIPDNGYKVFLAGSIEMGAATDWQKDLLRLLPDQIIVLNPRRSDWDSSWEQKADNPQFREQVEWELAALEACDKILMYFAPGTKAPISLLEFGLFAKSGKMIVCCPEGFWRKGNVDIVCERYGVRSVESLEILAQSI